MTREECIKAGYDISLCDFWENGNLHTRYEWSADKTVIDIVESYHVNGNLDSRLEWNADKTKTCTVELYYANGNLHSRYEWNEDRTETIRKQP